MKLCVAGEGAFGNKHLDALDAIDGVEVVSLVGGDAGQTEKVANERGIAHWTLNLAEGLSQAGVEGVVLATPTPIHATQAIQCLQAGKHVLVEIPMADSLADATALDATRRQTGLIAMVGHVRRFNPSHQWIKARLATGEMTLQHLEVRTHFMRRSNLNALGQPRSWTDHLLWHHACHTIDLFAYQTGEAISQCTAMEGPPHPELGIAMDMSIGLKSASGALCTLALSFNNDGPLGTDFRYICDKGTYIARYDDLEDGWGKPVDLSELSQVTNGIELMDREFVSAIREKRKPRSCVGECMQAMHVIDQLEQQLARG